MEFAVLRAIFVINAILQLVGARPGGMGGIGGSSKRIYMLAIVPSSLSFIPLF